MSGSWVPFGMLILAGFFVGGVISFARSRRVFPAVALGIAAVLSLVAAWVWWSPA